MTPSAAAVLALLMTDPAAAGSPLELAHAWSQPTQRAGTAGIAIYGAGATLATTGYLVATTTTCRPPCEGQAAAAFGSLFLGGLLVETGLVMSNAAATVQASRLTRADVPVRIRYAEIGWSQVVVGWVGLAAGGVAIDWTGNAAVAVSAGAILAASPIWFALQARDNRRALRAATLAPKPGA